MEEIDIVCLERALMLSLERALLEFSSLEGPPSPNVYDSICESLSMPHMGIVNVLLNCGIHVGSCYCDVV